MYTVRLVCISIFISHAPGIFLSGYVNMCTNGKTFSVHLFHEQQQTTTTTIQWFMIRHKFKQIDIICLVFGSCAVPWINRCKLKRAWFVFWTDNCRNEKKQKTTKTYRFWMIVCLELLISYICKMWSFVSFAVSKSAYACHNPSRYQQWFAISIYLFRKKTTTTKK